MRRPLAWTIAVGLLVTAVAPVWGPLPTASAGGNDDTLAHTFIELISEAWSEDPALVALRARDRGYDLTQTIDGIGAQALAEDGTITEDGDVVTPAEPAPGVLDREGESDVVAALGDTQKSVTKSKSVNPPDEYLDGGAFMLVILLGLMAEGYTTEQIIVDGILAEGIRAPCPFCPVDIVDEENEVVSPGDAGDEDDTDLEDLLVESVIRDMVTLVQGGDPLDPDFRARYDVTYRAELPGDDAPTTITAKGRLGPGSDADDLWLGRMKGTIEVEAGECPAETVSVVITLSGEKTRARSTILDQSYVYVDSSTGSRGEDPSVFSSLCISAAEAPELVAAIGPSLGRLHGEVAPGETLESVAGNFGQATLDIKARAR